MIPKYPNTSWRSFGALFLASFLALIIITFSQVQANSIISTIDVSTFTGGHHYQGADGVQGADGADGEDGKDGTSGSGVTSTLHGETIISVSSEGYPNSITNHGTIDNFNESVQGTATHQEYASFKTESQKELEAILATIHLILATYATTQF